MSDVCFVCPVSERCALCRPDCAAVIDLLDQDVLLEMCDDAIRAYTDESRLEYRSAWFDYIDEDYQ